VQYGFESVGLSFYIAYDLGLNSTLCLVEISDFSSSNISKIILVWFQHVLYIDFLLFLFFIMRKMQNTREFHEFVFLF
jgi:hypothetical protein